MKVTKSVVLGRRDITAREFVQVGSLVFWRHNLHIEVFIEINEGGEHIARHVLTYVRLAYIGLSKVSLVKPITVKSIIFYI